MATIDGSVCLNHPNVPATCRCSVCRKPICDECAIRENGAVYCSQNCRADAIRTGAKVNTMNEHKAAGDAKRATAKLIWWIIILAIIGAGVWYYMTHKEQVNGWFNQAKATVEQKAGEMKQTIKDNTVDRGSTYKRNVEAIDKSE